MSELKNIYDNISAEFNASRQHPWPELEVVIPYIRDGFNILDLGCGNGRMLKLFATSGKKFDYLGIDFSEELIKQARVQFPQHTFQVADIRQLDIAPASFDLVVMIAAFHHLETKKERERLLSHIYRWLKPGGYLFMTNWHLWQIKYLPYLWKNIGQKKSWNDCFIPWQKYSGDQNKMWRYYHAFTRGELNSLLRQVGFRFFSQPTYRAGHNLISLVVK